MVEYHNLFIKLIIFSGLPNSGKSTLAKAVAGRFYDPIISVDPVESPIISAGFARSYATGLAAYIIARALASEQLTVGNNVIIDAVNAEEESKNIWRDLAKSFGLSMIIIQTGIADEILHRYRTEAQIRNMAGIPEVTWEDIVEKKAAYTAWTEPILEIDSSDTLNHNLTAATIYIESTAYTNT